MDIPATTDSNSQTKQPAAGAEQATKLSADRTLDITRDTCPMTFVRTRLALDRLQPGQCLLVRLQGDEPRLQVPQSARALGHAVLAEQPQPDGSVLLWLRRA